MRFEGVAGEFAQFDFGHNVVESPFAAVRLRTNAGKRFERVDNAALIWKLLTVT